MAYAPFQQDFFNSMWPHAQQQSILSGIDPRIIFAQSALESNWGRSAPNNNYFGIKGPGGTQTTREFLNGQWVTTQDSFRGYANMGDSASGYTDFIKSNPRYKSFLNAIGLDNQLAALGKSGYATDPGYVGKLKSIIGNLPEVSSITKTVSKGVDFAVDAAEMASYIVTGNWLAAGKKLLDGDVGEALGMGGNKKDDGPLAKFIAWLKELFSANTAARAAAIIVGFILIAGAIFFLTGTDKTIVEAAKTAVKVAA